MSRTRQCNASRVPEVVRRLRSIAISSLARMYLPEERLFAFRLRRDGDGSDRPCRRGPGCQNQSARLLMDSFRPISGSGYSIPANVDRLRKPPLPHGLDPPRLTSQLRVSEINLGRDSHGFVEVRPCICRYLGFRQRSLILIGPASWAGRHRGWLDAN